MKRLIGTKWGATHRTLRTSTLALVCAPAGYCVPIWCRAVLSHKIGVVLNETMRAITEWLNGILTSYLLVWLELLL